MHPVKLLLFTAPDGLLVYVVDGCWVRDHYDIEYIGGGHCFAGYDIPDGEIWVESMPQDHDTMAIACHEVAEYYAMARLGLPYLVAHVEHGLAAEREYRLSPSRETADAIVRRYAALERRDAPPHRDQVCEHCGRTIYWPATSCICGK